MVNDIMKTQWKYCSYIYFVQAYLIPSIWLILQYLHSNLHNPTKTYPKDNVLIMCRMICDWPENSSMIPNKGIAI
jgi:hypothetical protein